MIAVSPNDADAMSSLAFLLADTGAQLDEAIALAERALRVTPDSDALKDTLGLIYVRKNQGESGVEVLRTLASKYPDAPLIRYHFGLALAETGQKAQAQAEFEAALSKGASGSVRKAILTSLGRDE